MNENNSSNQMPEVQTKNVLPKKYECSWEELYLFWLYACFFFLPFFDFLYHFLNAGEDPVHNNVKYKII